ncbi:MAG: EamA family transporter [Gluconacetobacter diazotrophicus]|nr:EamA family transporter [Gluconacetobacter diazotrophicus]
MNTLRTLAVWLLLCAIWSSTWSFIKVGLHDLPPLLFAGARFVLASALLLGINLARRKPWPASAREWGFVAVTGGLQFSINYGLLFWGEEQITSGLAAVLQATIPAFGLAFAHFYLPAERLTLLKAAGVVLGLVGIGVIFADQLHLSGTLALWGSLAVVVGAAAAAYASVLVKAYAHHLDPAVLAGGQMFFGWLPLVAVGWATEGAPWRLHWTGAAIFEVCYLAVVGSAVAFCLYYWLVRRVDVTRTMLISLVTPVAAILIGWAVLDEHLPGRTLAGGLCVLAGLGLVIYRRGPRVASAPPARALESVEG